MICIAHGRIDCDECEFRARPQSSHKGVGSIHRFSKGMRSWSCGCGAASRVKTPPATTAAAAASAKAHLARFPNHYFTASAFEGSRRIGSWEWRDNEIKAVI